MAIREDVVVSAVSFLHDPNVISAPIENKLSFLRAKNLTQEEIDAAFARAGGSPPPSGSSQAHSVSAQLYNPYGQPPPYGWQDPPSEPPKRDWRDWFIMATVVGGVSYGLYSISKRYLFPLVAPPTPEKLQQDKATVDQQFEKAFSTLEQLAKDTETLKESEAARTEKLDKAVAELEAFVRDAGSAARRQEEEAERLREDLKNINTIIPKSMAAHKEFTDGRLKEIGNEVKSLKSLISQRMNSAAPTSIPSPVNGGPFRTMSISNAPAANSLASPPVETKDNGSLSNGNSTTAQAENKSAAAAPSVVPSKQDYMATLGGRPSPFGSPFGSGAPAVKASIPPWQLPAQNAGAKAADNTGVASSGSSAVTGTTIS